MKKRILLVCLAILVVSCQSIPSIKPTDVLEPTNPSVPPAPTNSPVPASTVISHTPGISATPTELTTKVTFSNANTFSTPKIDRHPQPYNLPVQPISSIPTFIPEHVDNPFQVDLRSKDISMIDTRGNEKDLFYAYFDTRTVWPSKDRLAVTFDYEKIMELGKDPGLGVRSLHTSGISGQGVNVAIIDQFLLVDHQEYKDQLKLYEEVGVTSNTKNKSASMHGAALASILVGKTIGVAPGAKMYYIGLGDLGFVTYADAVRRIIEVNRQLPEGQKIRVLSLSVGWLPNNVGYSEMEAAVQDAIREGIFVISSTISEDYPGFKFNGLGRYPLADPNNFASYEPGLWWALYYYNNLDAGYYTRFLHDSLLVPMDSRTIASFTGPGDYAFGQIGGWSWCTPYLAGMYALAVQVNPNVTPEKFWNSAMQTGKTIQIQHGGETFTFGPIIDPVKLVNSLK